MLQDRAESLPEAFPPGPQFVLTHSRKRCGEILTPRPNRQLPNPPLRSVCALLNRTEEIARRQETYWRLVSQASDHGRSQKQINDSLEFLASIFLRSSGRGRHIESFGGPVIRSQR